MNKRPYKLLVFDLQGTLAENGRFLDGTTEMLKELKTKGYVIAAATNWGRTNLEQLLQALPDDFSFIATRNASDSSPKPNPQMLIEIMDELGFTPSETLMIGDTLGDIEFANNAKVDSIAVTYSGTPKALFDTKKPTVCLDNVSQLKAWFYL